MPRVARTLVPQGVYHLISRLVDHRFEMDDLARWVYLDRLAQALRNTDWRLIGFALMSSHIHLAAVAGRTALRNWIHPAHTAWANWVSRRRRESGQKCLGQVLGDRPREIVIVPEGTAALLAYLHNNPVRAAVVPVASESGWTSHQFYVGRRTPPKWLDIDTGFALCGLDNAPEGHARFNEHVEKLGAFEAAEQRALLRKATIVEGGESRSASDQADPVARDPAEFLFRLCDEARLSVAELQGPSRNRQLTRVRAQAIMEWMREGGTQKEMAERLGISSAAATRLRLRHFGAKVKS